MAAIFKPSKTYGWYHSRFLDIYHLATNENANSLFEIREWMHDYLNQTPVPNGWTAETVRTYMNALVQLVKDEADFLGGDAPSLVIPILKELRSERHVLTKRLYHELKENKPAPNERTFSWQQILDTLDFIERETENWAQAIVPSKTAYFYRKWQQRLLLSMYVYQECPLRSDYSKVWLSPVDPIPEEDNYIRDGIFYLQTDKVVQYKGRARYPMNERNLVLINRMEHYFGPRSFLITDNKHYDKPIDETGYQAVKSNCRSLLADIHDPNSGKKYRLGVNAIRSAFISEYMANPFHSVADWERMAIKMRNSRTEWEMYYRRVPTEEIKQEVAATDAQSLIGAITVELPEPIMQWSPLPSPAGPMNPQIVTEVNVSPTAVSSSLWMTCDLCGRQWDGFAQCDCEFRDLHLTRLANNISH